MDRSDALSRAIAVLELKSEESIERSKRDISSADFWKETAKIDAATVKVLREMLKGEMQWTTN